MSSNAYLYVPAGDGRYLCARVRWSGYLTGVGPYLWKFYSELAQAQALVARGWIESIEADPARVIAETMDGEWPQQMPDEATVLTQIGWGADNYVYRDGVWHHHVEGQPVVPVTRAVLEAAGIGAAWLDDPEPPQTFQERMRNGFVKAALENGSENVRYFHRDGNYGVVCG